ncbi:hypothetical protein CBM2631_A320035 [Cupriavidus taiwanensis]|nr:hypothetical protein CBM2631_A320035 [Cupriavidus taiwanensis]
MIVLSLGIGRIFLAESVEILKMNHGGYSSLNKETNR